MPRRPACDRGEPRPLTKAVLERAALTYLERYASSAENLRRVLRRRVSRAERLGAADGEAARGVVEEIVERFCSAGLLDDRAYAEMKAASLQRRGFSRRGVEQALHAKGVGSGQIQQALEAVGAGSWAAELEAAEAYARRRRLGPARPPERRAEYRERDLAALGRRGFSFEVARRVIDARLELQEGLGCEDNLAGDDGLGRHDGLGGQDPRDGLGCQDDGGCEHEPAGPGVVDAMRAAGRARERPAARPLGRRATSSTWGRRGR